MDRRIIPDAFETKNKNLSPESHILALQALNELLRGTVEDRASSGSSRKDPQNAFSRSLGSNLGHEYGLGGPSKKEISSTPDTLVSRKRTRQGKYLADTSMSEIVDLIHLTAKEASERLGMGLTSFKRVCRFHGIHSWPQNHQKHEKSSPGSKSESVAAKIGRDIAQAKQLMKLIQEDIERVEAIQMPPNEDARKEMFGNIKELYIISCRMRNKCGFSIFNDTVLLTLMRKLRS